ncbi:MAG: S24/S26 family peptidase [Clostridia bacterium]|nr:S24/S26 family peptidase [Clostridia bacterium]
MNNIELSMSEIWELANVVISSGGEFRLFHKGTSMMPLLRQGKDSVVLVAPNDIKKNDILLFKRANGQFVMHRAIKIKKNEYIMCGDNQYEHERGIKKENILAKVKGIYRGDVYFETDNTEYQKYVKRKLPVRRAKIRFLYFIGINKRA